MAEHVRIGIGSDIHRLVPGRPLIIGGVTIESDLGADGHSDADVLQHAVTDALLGALAMGDIGKHFPDSTEEWKDANSSILLAKVIKLVKWHNYEVVNVDSTIHLEAPKLQQTLEEMRDLLAKLLQIDRNQVSIKAKTGESVDAVGRREAVRAEAVVLLRKADT